MTNTRSIRPLDLRIGDTMIKSLGYRTIVESIIVRANDSILPHILVNGVTTIALRSSVDITEGE